MNRSVTYRVNLVGLAVVVASLVWLLPAPAKGAVLVYDLFAITPDALPQSPPWTSNGSGSKSVSDPSNVLTLVDNSSALGGYGPYFSNSAAITINSTTEYESRARLRIVSNTLSTSSFVYLQEIYDGSRYMAFGAARINPTTTRFYLADTSGGLLDGNNANAIDVTGDDFFQVDLKKTGTTGTATDIITLSINGTPVVTTSYTTLSSYGAAGALSWGEGSSATQGTVEVTGVSYGIGQPAPLLGEPAPIPEPASVGLLAIGLFSMQSRRRRA